MKAFWAVIGGMVFLVSAPVILKSVWDASLFGEGKARNLPAREAYALLEDSRTIPLDVRSRGEFEREHLPGAIHLPVDYPQQWEEILATLSTNQSYLVYCTGGVRSRNALRKLLKADFQYLHHLDFGIVAWKANDLPLEQP